MARQGVASIVRDGLLKKLICPVHRRPLKLEVGERADDGHVMTGRLVLEPEGLAYPIERGVPNMLPSGGASVEGDDLSSLQRNTIERFGYEWRHFRDWGWLEEYPEGPNAEEHYMGALLENSRNAFWSKTLFEDHDLKPGNLVLDAGCGNGRFVHQASLTGAEVIGIDLGPGVFSAFDHMRSEPNVHVVRGDLFRLPFLGETFDRIFSIGVLMHTGNANSAFDSIARTLGPGGLIVAHVYGKGQWTYELGDASLRAVATRLPLGAQVKFARFMARLTRWLRADPKRRRRLYDRIFPHINLLPTEHHMFDWWCAPIATHHTPEEVAGWFDADGLTVIRTHPPRNAPAKERMRKRLHAAVTFLGCRNPKRGD